MSRLASSRSAAGFAAMRRHDGSESASFSMPRCEAPLNCGARYARAFARMALRIAAGSSGAARPASMVQDRAFAAIGPFAKRAASSAARGARCSVPCDCGIHQQHLVALQPVCRDEVAGEMDGLREVR